LIIRLLCSESHQSTLQSFLNLSLDVSVKQTCVMISVSQP
jgi:hypothetical protein